MAVFPWKSYDRRRIIGGRNILPLKKVLSSGRKKIIIQMIFGAAVKRFQQRPTDSTACPKSNDEMSNICCSLNITTFQLLKAKQFTEIAADNGF